MNALKSFLKTTLVGGLLFLLAHGGYMLFSQHRKRPSEEVAMFDEKLALTGTCPGLEREHGIAGALDKYVKTWSNGVDGQIKLAQGKSLDYETANSHTITVKATSTDGGSALPSRTLRPT